MGKEAALLGQDLFGGRRGQGGGLCATCGLGGAWTKLQDTPRPHTSRSRAMCRFLSPEQRVPQTQPSPQLGLRGEAPSRSGPSWDTGFHGPGNRSSSQAAGPLLPWASTWAQEGCCRRAPAVSRTRADAGPALFALSQPALCVRDPRAPHRGAGRGAGRWTGGRRRGEAEDIRLEGRSGWGMGRGWTAAMPAREVGTRQPKVAAAAAGRGCSPERRLGVGDRG